MNKHINARNNCAISTGIETIERKLIEEETCDGYTFGFFADISEKSWAFAHGWSEIERDRRRFGGEAVKI